MELPYISDEEFTQKNISQNPLKKGEYEHCIFQQCDLTDMDLSDYKFINCVFHQCNLSMVKLNKTLLQEIEFFGCKMLGCHFDRCDDFGLAVAFEDCQLDQSSFYQLNLKNTRFINTRLREVDFTETDLSKALFEHCDLSGATFEHTSLEESDLRTAYNFSINPEKNRLKKARFSIEGLPGLLEQYNLNIEP